MTAKKQKMAHLKLLFILLLIGATVRAGINLQKRVVGGKTCKDEERRYHVQLMIDTPRGRGYCGGSLISKTWILTIAHCLLQQKPVQKLSAILGVHPEKAPKITVEIKKKPVIYNDGQNHDIMLLELEESTDIHPVALPNNCEHQTPLKVVQFAGYGTKTPLPGQKKVGKNSDDLQCVDLDIVACPKVNDPEHIVCYQSKDKDTCPGDSGGGVIFQDQIYGVHGGSFSSIACEKPGYFLDVCKYLHWIEEKVGKTN